MRSVICYVAAVCLFLVPSMAFGGNDFKSGWGQVEDSCRPFVRWWWNGDKLQKEEITRELELQELCVLQSAIVNIIGLKKIV